MAQSTQFNVKEFLSLLQCPFGLDPLTTAVNLFPCCHKVNQAAAEKYYGQLIQGFCSLKGRTCVLCRQEVVSYAPDHTIRDLASRIFNHENALEALPTHPLVLEEKKNLSLPYPGLPAVFICTKDNWNKPVDNGDGYCRKLYFESATSNSLLEKFDLLGSWEGTVSLTIVFSKIPSEAVEEYLKAHRFVGKGTFTYQTRTLEELKKLFHIIASNNEIPASHFNTLREIIERGACDPTPRFTQRNGLRLHDLISYSH